MNTHNIDIELPPLPEGFISYEFPDGGYDEDEMRTYARAAIEADRQQSGTRTSRSVAQLKEALLSRNQRFVATHSEVKNLIEYYEADRQRRRADYLISACYFPNASEVELTWERKSDGAKAALTCKVTPEQGGQIANVVWPCVYHTATPQPAAPKYGEEE